MSRFNLRNQPRISYYEPDEPNLDEYVFCSQCGDFVYEFCSIHGPLLVIPDDKLLLDRSQYMNIGAGLGVFTTLALPSGVRFGPYEGKKTEEITSMYCWQINDYNNERWHVIDAEDPNKSNWMRYVNCSRHWCEQNLIAYQYRGRLYYRTIKIIPRYTELMVFYGSEFAHKLQIDLKKYNAPTSYAQKFGGPPSTSLSTNSIKEKSSKSSENNSNLKKMQKNEVSDDVTATNIKVKCNVPKKPEKEKKKITHDISSNKKYHSLKVKKNTSSKKNPTAEINLKSQEKNISVKSCDFNNNVNVKTECLKQLSKITNEENLKTTVSKDNESVIECDFKKLDIIINKSSKEKDDSFQSKALVQKFFSCNICDYKTLLEKSLKSHLLAHGAKNKYTCSYCDYITKRQHHLICHIRTHTGEKPYACNYCEKKFNKKINLTCHIRTHTGEKPYACNYCEKKFNHKISLTCHIRTHTGEKPYACNYCEKKFNHKISLTYHIRTHNTEICVTSKSNI